MRRSHTCRRRRRVVAIAVALIAVAQVGSSEAIGAECWRPPVTAPVTDPFRAPPCPWCPGNRGIKYSTPTGTPVRAVSGGVVSFAGVVAGTRYVVVEHLDGRRATYGGLVDTTVRRGDQVIARLVVGHSSDSVHFGLRDGTRYVDPAPHLGRTVYPFRLVPVDGSPAPAAGPPRVVCDRPESAPTTPVRRHIVSGRNPRSAR